MVEVAARIELDLVADDRGGALAGRRRGGDDGQHRAVVDVGVVGEDVDQDVAFSLGRGGVGIGDRRVVDAGDVEDERAGVAAVIVGDGVVEAVRTFSPCASACAEANRV